MVAQHIDPHTGHVDPSGVPLRPEDLHATLLEIMGLEYEHLRQEAPSLLHALMA